mgnify:CR=1 FL=1
MIHRPHGSKTGGSATEHDTKTEADASGGYREEYAYQGVDPDLRPDGGRGYVLPTEGKRVVDREDDDPDDAIVLKALATTTAREHYIDELDATVAETNPQYDPLAPVVVVAFAADLEDERRPGEDLRDVLADGGRDAPRYAFPAPRVEAVDGGGRRV